MRIELGLSNIGKEKMQKMLSEGMSEEEAFMALLDESFSSNSNEDTKGLLPESLPKTIYETKVKKQYGN